jgi:hypothetical protein
MALLNYVLTADIQASWPAVWSELVSQAPNTPVSTPAVPATGIAQYNNTGQAVVVTVTGGTVTVIAVGGVTTGLTSGAVVVPAGSSITLTFSAAPTWSWAGLVAATPGAGETVQVGVTAPPGGQAGAVPLMFWRKGMLIMMDIATPNGAALQAAIGGGNLRAAVAGDLVGHEGLSN